MANRQEDRIRPEVGEAGGDDAKAKPACPPDDVELLQRLREGDEKALEIASDRNWLPVYRFVRRIVGNRHAAEDVLQETFLRFWVRREKWRPERPILTILRRIAVNLSKDYIRSRRVRCECLAFGPRPASPEAPDEAVERKELKEAVWSAIGELSKRRRRALVLVHFEGSSYQEAAEQMGISPQTVANHLTAARKELKAALALYADDDYY